jgi:hypothetical protein
MLCKSRDVADDIPLSYLWIPSLNLSQDTVHPEVFPCFPQSLETNAETGQEQFPPRLPYSSMCNNTEH